MGCRPGGRIHRLRVTHAGSGRGTGAFDAATIAQPLAAFTQ